MNPTLYDILGVRPDASPDEIKRAWREAADRFEPGAGSSAAQFRLFNEAAEVLLDPQRRREYDERLEVERRERSAGTGTTEPAAQGSGVSPATPAPQTITLAEDRATGTGPEPGPSPAAPGNADGESPRPRRAGPPLWAMVAAGVLALVLVAAAAWLGLRTFDVREVRRSSAVADARTASTATAERAAAVILSYDYKTLDADEKAAERYMTAGYAKKYAKTFDKLVRGNATDLHAHVEATVRASGVVTADPDRADVLLFVDQSTLSKANDGQKQTALNRVEMKMVEQDGRWLVNDITSY